MEEKEMEYVIVRSEKAGVFAGYLDTRCGTEVVLRRARRIYYWSGAATLSQLAMDGTSDPANCKFPCETEKHLILGVIEVISVTSKAQKSIAEVPVWAK